jgi:hypothetical protein
MPNNFADLKKLEESRFAAWEKRQDYIDKILLRNYKTAYQETIDQMAKLYAKVGLKTPIDGRSIRMEDAVHYRQLENKLDNIASEMVKLRNKGVKLTEENSANSIQDAYYGNQWALEQTVGVVLPIPALPVGVIRASVFSDESGLNLVKTWEKNSMDARWATQATITRGVTQGYSYTKMARAIKDQFDKGLWQAMRVVRTEAGRNWSEGAEALHGKATELGLEVRKRWSAALDMRTRTTHASLDGTYADDKGLFWIDGSSAEQPRLFGVAAEDINCRCSAYDVLDDIGPTVRRIRGKGIQPYQTFEEWATPAGWTKERGWPKLKL